MVVMDGALVPSEVADEQEAQSERLTLPEFRRRVLSALDEAQARKEEGNVLLTSGSVVDAEQKYVAALEILGCDRYISSLMDKERARSDMEDLRGRARMLELSISLNLALGALRQGHWAAAEAWGDSALAIDKKSVKALYRVSTALYRQGRGEDALVRLREAEKLDPANAEVRNLRRRVTNDCIRKKKAETCAYRGLFSSSGYIAERDEEEEKAEKAMQVERRTLATGSGLAGHATSAEEGGIIDRWVSSGARALDPEERVVMEKLVRQVAAAGNLDDVEQRSAFAKHGLENAFSRKTFESELSEEERVRWQEQQELSRIKHIMAKGKNQESLTEEERRLLLNFHDGEIKRLEGKYNREGLSQDENFLLQKLKEKKVKDEEKSKAMRLKSDQIENIMGLINRDVRVPVRQRLEMLAMLEEEEKLLEEKDDTVGLSTKELRLLTDLKTQRKQREEKKRAQQQRQEFIESRS